MLEARFCDKPPDAAFIAAPEATGHIFNFDPWRDAGDANPLTNEGWDILDDSRIYRGSTTNLVSGVATWEVEYDVPAGEPTGTGHLRMRLVDITGPEYIFDGDPVTVQGAGHYKLTVSGQADAINFIELIAVYDSGAALIDYFNRVQAFSALMSKD